MERTETTAPRLSWTRADLATAIGLTLLAAIVRLVRLGSPPFLAGDERFYVNDACWYLFSSGDVCAVAREMNLEHPPLGKWIVAASMQMFGDGRVGQRLLVALIGALTIPLLYLLGRQLLQSRVGAAAAAGLLVFDFSHFPLSRVAMLDVPLVFFTVLAFVFMARARVSPEGSDLRWRCAAGAAAGAAIATKWTGVTVLGVLIALGFAWDVLARRKGDEGRRERHPVWKALRERGPGWLLAFVALPALVYSLTFLGRVHGDLLALPWSETSWLNALWDRQVTTFEFHAHHIWSHRYASEPWSWPLAKRGFVMAGAIVDDGRLVIATGNPIVWTAGILSTIYVGVRWFRMRTIRSAEGFILMGVALTYLPWFLYFYAPWAFFTWGRVATFIFYFLPTLPLLYIALGYVAARAALRRSGRVAIGVSAALVTAMFAFYYPVMTYVPLSNDALDRRFFAFDNCEVRGRDLLVLNPTTLPDGSIRYGRKVAPPEWFAPPEGWCWL